MRVWELAGDYDLMWVNCSVKDDNVLLDRAVHEGLHLDASRVVELAWSNRFKKSDRLPVDCPRFPAYGTVMLSEKAALLLKHLLERAGYLINAKLDAEISYKLFICTREIDALDLSHSDVTYFPSGNVCDVTRYEFKKTVELPPGIFRMRHRRSKIFVSDSFVEIVTRNHLSGFVFTEVWDSNTGGTALPLPQLPLEQVKGEFARRASAKRAALRKQLSV